MFDFGITMVGNAGALCQVVCFRDGSFATVTAALTQIHLIHI